ncbi:hypothetical protein B5M09_011401 [Aphanomyces astaci]|uniref:Peptidase A2 domain-containing protein n=1 Tax=Aphanomyces astaci TaxID=112090 RepID=A0A3R8D3T8_APHAT|nr:hypothetical protein B5M09_011401 [Aphanomyces astaci]
MCSRLPFVVRLYAIVERLKDVHSVTSTGATNLPHVPDDDNMGQGDERGFVYNAPALPDPPSFNESTKSEWRTFIPVEDQRVPFVDWLRVHTAGYHLYTPVEKEKSPVTPAAAAAAPTWPPKPGRTEGSGSSNSGPPQRAPVPEQDSAKNERKKATCLECGTENHKVVNCPKCAPGECERLLKEQINKWVSARNKKVTKLQGSANKSFGREAKIEGIVTVTTTLLDTGSNVTLVTAGVMKSLKRAGVEVKVISPEPSVIQPYGQAPTLNVDRQMQFKLVTLDTPCGSLALRGLKAWVDSSSNAAELLIRRAVMERLGFSEDELLSHAFAKQEVWDVSDHGDVFRLEIGHDEPINVEPLRMRIMPVAVPVKCGLRRYPPAHVEFLKAHVSELEAAGLVYHNNRATWASAPRIVPKNPQWSHARLDRCSMPRSPKT